LRLPLHNAEEIEMAFDVSFLKYVNVSENVDIDKSIDVSAHVFGNSALANATADALGHNTTTETLTQTSVAQGIGSSSVSESLSATNGSFWHW
jgi:uncharacterized protein involved in propanediol utilization